MPILSGMTVLNNKIRRKSVIGRRRIKYGGDVYVSEHREDGVSLFKFKAGRKFRKVIPFETLIKMQQEPDLIDFMGIIYQKKK